VVTLKAVNRRCTARSCQAKSRTSKLAHALATAPMFAGVLGATSTTRTCSNTYTAHQLFSLDMHCEDQLADSYADTDAWGSNPRGCIHTSSDRCSRVLPLQVSAARHLPSVP
jgi:hypothetical protein